MKKTRRKLNIDNLFYLIVFAFSVTLIVSDITIMAIMTATGRCAMWTWFGFTGFVAAFIFASWSYEELKEYLDNKKEK